MTAAASIPVADPSPVAAMGRGVAAGFLRAAAVLLLASLVFGLLVATYYTPLAPRLNAIGLRLYLLRPLHTGAAIGWIYLGGMAMVHRWLFDHLERTLAPERALAVARGLVWRARAQLWLWTACVLIAALAYASGYTSGREYLEYPPWLALPILAGWLLFAVNFAKVTGFALARLPVYAWMWGTSVFLFVFSFVEAHAWVLDWLLARPVRDLAIQWKAMGSLVGSFNLLVYGSIAWLGTRLSGDDRYARSHTAYALFLVGVLNSFTNYGHHTYHLAQGEAMKWVSFVVSMSEIVIFAKVVWDCTRIGRAWAARGGQPAISALLIATTGWTALQLLLALVISVPPLNAVVHGTLAIAAHSMGTLIGIDTMAMLAVGLWLVHESGAAAPVVAARRLFAIIVANIGLALLWASLLWVGVGAGWQLLASGRLPWIGVFPGWLGSALIVAGSLLLTGIAPLAWPMLRRQPRSARAIAASCR